MRILLDENLPRKLVDALRIEGHNVESVRSLKMPGLDNGKLYRFAISNFDPCFTRFWLRQQHPPKHRSIKFQAFEGDLETTTSRYIRPQFHFSISRDRLREMPARRRLAIGVQK